MKKRKDTTIPLLKTTKIALKKKRLVPGETWDSILNRLMQGKGELNNGRGGRKRKRV